MEHWFLMLLKDLRSHASVIKRIRTKFSPWLFGFDLSEIIDNLGPILAESVDPAREITTKLCFSFPLPGWLCEEDRGLNKIIRTVPFVPIFHIIYKGSRMQCGSFVLV